MEGDSLLLHPYGQPLVIPKGHVWLAGDNTANSTDSRHSRVRVRVRVRFRVRIKTTVWINIVFSVILTSLSLEGHTDLCLKHWLKVLFFHCPKS